MFDVNKIIEYLATFIAVLLVLCVHEFSHAFVAVKFGDETPRVEGRYTLNPMAHVDWIGLIMMFFVGFGWAKPVPINPCNFKNIKKGYFWTSISGVISNYIFAFISLPLFYLSLRFLPSGSFVQVFLMELFLSIFSLNLCFFVFNLLPIYPLDGYRVLEVFVNGNNKVMQFLRYKGQYILFALLALSFLADWIPALDYIDILDYFMMFSMNIVGKPISLFWGLIF